SRAGLEVNKLEQALAEFRNRICLEVEQCVNNVNSAYRVLDVSRLAVRSAGENFRMVARKYEEGLVPQIEYMDAQTAMTRARIEKTMALYDYLIQLSGLKLTVADAGINLKQTPGGI
ncbi:MAG: TolC family protein, partial [Gemmatimonadota bacterium]|nr:TolC family protein [Gemmatimonadota bacterium]